MSSATTVATAPRLYNRHFESTMVPNAALVLPYKEHIAWGRGTKVKKNGWRNAWTMAAVAIVKVD